jgi:hypothetical protein
MVESQEDELAFGSTEELVEFKKWKDGVCFSKMGKVPNG